METKQGYMKIVRYRKQLVIIIVSVVLLGLIYLVWSTYFRPPPWLFKGAYAKYYGETSYLFLTAKVTVRMEVLDFNRTHYKVLYYTKMESSLGTQEDQAVKWYSLTSSPEGVARRYETTVYLDTLEITRECSVCEFQDGSACYYDKKTGWIIKMKYRHDSYSVDLNLIETNIPL